ncbi:MAG: ABC transporter ATP-binding protein [Tissierellia bacterium]|nr:ABC transporter ATP-binding protein [Tissierellia bacterium]
MIELKNISKSYKDKLVLNNISTTLEKGKIYGLLGRNGAGKTTLLRILSNLIVKYDGFATLESELIKENQDVVEDIILVHSKMIPSTFDSESVNSIYKWAAIMLPNWDEDYKNKLVQEFELNLKTKYSKLSEGNKNLVALILGLAANTKVVFFDEPSTGLDANNRYKFYEILMEDMEERERYCIISTHIIDEVEKIFEEVMILENNQFILQEEISTLQEKAIVASGNENILSNILKSKNIIDEKSIGGMKIISIYDTLTDEERMSLKANNVELKSIPLQDLFVLLTEKEARNEIYK